MNTIIHPKGTRLYIASAGWSQNPVPCPVCNGLTRLLVKPVGADDKSGTEISCEYCRWAERDGLPRGQVVETWSYKPHVSSFTVEGTEVLDRGNKKEIKYLYNVTSNSWNHVAHDKVFTSKEAADTAAVKMAEEATAAHAAKAIQYPNGSYSIGYAKKQIADAEKTKKLWQNQLVK